MTRKRKQPITESSEWSFELLTRFDEEIARIAKDEYQLSTYPNQIEVITAEQMMDAYSSVGMPVNYNHWSFGKQFLNTEKNYQRGRMGLAYEIVINSSPCIAYLMEENTMCMQALVIAHASYGHNSFFKNNYLFKTWTNAEAIIDYLLFAKNYIRRCEETYGITEVEKLLDSCHALMNYGVDRYKRPAKLSLVEEMQRQKSRENHLQSLVNDLWRKTIPNNNGNRNNESEERFPSEPQENLLYFFEKNAPLLEPWQREIVRIVRKLAQYFYPQRQTKVMNEGWACFIHYQIMNKLYDEGLINESYMLEFLQSHSSVVYQPSFDSPYYSGINPYALGYSMMMDIRRICDNPTAEDREWFPKLVDTNWLESLHFAVDNFKDESFIAQYLSPKMIREFKLFTVLDDDENDELRINAIHDNSGYQTVRQSLANQYNLGDNEPNIQVYSVNMRGDRSLVLRHNQHNRKPLNERSANEVLKHVHRLWGFDVHLEIVNPSDKILHTYHCPPKPEQTSPLEESPNV